MNSIAAKYTVVAAIALLAACTPDSEKTNTVAESEIVGPEYSASRGLYVPEETRRSLGLKVVPIGEEKVATTHQLSLRVFDVGRDSVQAAGFVLPAEARGLSIGRPVDVTTNGGLTLPGRISALNEHVQQVTGNLELIVAFGPSPDVSFGSFVTAELWEEGKGVVTTVPRSALIHAIDGTFVYTASGEQFMRTPVAVGALTAETAEIIEGLYSGDEVVAEPAMSLWLTELAAIKGGHACCVIPAKGR